MKQPDFSVIGGGVVGLSVALELARRYPGARIVVLEKEDRVGFHASGRNSGVLHAGFYYTADSLKARFTRDGNRLWRELCDEQSIALNRCGKLVVARDASELAGLDELLRRGQANGVELEMLDAADARRIEPRIKTFERALWSPTTTTVDPLRALGAIVAACQRAGVEIRFGERYEGRSGATIRTTLGASTPGYVVNCAGLQADRVAKDFGHAQNLVVLPFKGLYVYSDEPAGSLRTNVYPVPDLKNPFLGVHFTVTADGRAKIGPTAIPAFWREHYDGLSRFDAKELVEIVSLEAKLMWSAGFDFRGLAIEEVKKYWRPRLIRQASALLEGVRPSQYVTWGKPGIRAQLLDVRTRKLVMDFCVEGDDRSYHVLNAVSPAFTCAIPFARHVVDDIDRLTGNVRRAALTTAEPPSDAHHGRSEQDAPER